MVGSECARDVERAAHLLDRPSLVFRRCLTGGEHARTMVAGDGVGDVVLRRFPPGDTAGRHEMVVNGRLAALDGLAPRLLAAADDHGDGALLVRSPAWPVTPSRGWTCPIGSSPITTSGRATLFGGMAPLSVWSTGRVHEWDLPAAAQAVDVVGTWAPNYLGIGLPDLTPDRLETRMAAWVEVLLAEQGS